MLDPANLGHVCKMSPQICFGDSCLLWKSDSLGSQFFMILKDRKNCRNGINPFYKWPPPFFPWQWRDHIHSIAPLPLSIRHGSMCFNIALTTRHTQKKFAVARDLQNMHPMLHLAGELWACFMCILEEKRGHQILIFSFISIQPFCSYSRRQE